MEAVARKQGFGLIQVIVAMALMGVIAMGMASLFRQSMVSQNSVRAVSDIDNALGVADLLLSDSQVCMSALAGATFDGNDTPVVVYQPLRDAAGVPIPGNVPGAVPMLNANQPVQGGNIPVTSVVLRAVPPGSANRAPLVAPAVGSSWITSIDVQLNRDGSSATGGALRRSIGIRLETNAANQITTCRTLGTSSNMPPPAGPPCNPNEIFLGYDANWRPSCIPNPALPMGAMILGPTTPPPDQAEPMTCTMKTNAFGQPDPNGNKLKVLPCGTPKRSCVFQDGQWMTVDNRGRTGSCTEGVTVDLPDEGDRLVDMNEYPDPAIDPIATRNVCKAGAKDIVCTSVVSGQQTASPTRPAGSNSLQFGTTVYPAPSGGNAGICVYEGGKWMYYPRPKNTNNRVPAPVDCSGGIQSTSRAP